MFFMGRGTDQDDAEAAVWFREAAKRGHSGAQFNLGAMYLEGRGVAKDMDAGLELLHKAADQGHTNAQKIIDQISAGS